MSPVRNLRGQTAGGNCQNRQSRDDPIRSVLVSFRLVPKRKGRDTPAETGSALM